MRSWSEVTALFGGTFDPPHRGHRIAVEGLFRHPGIRKAVILPSAAPPHKASKTTLEHRVLMTRLTFEGMPDVEIDLREAIRAEKTKQPTYTYDTLQEFRRDFGSLAFVIGTDQLRDLPTWYRFPEVLPLCHWIVLIRKPDGQELARKTMQQWEASGLVHPAAASDTWTIANSDGGRQTSVLSLVPTEAPALSSTEIRETIGRTGSPPPDSLMPGVMAYLKQQGVYGSHAGT